MQSPHSVLITGASSGLGAALATLYAASGVTLFLSGRHWPRLDNIAETCRAKGATVHATVVDVTDRDAMAAWIAESDALAPLDLVIANAGISGGSGGDGSTDGSTLGRASKIESAEQARRIFAVNVDGAMNTVLPAIDAMRAHAPRDNDGAPFKGQIAIVSSLAGFRGLPGAPAYCASKAAVRAWGEGLRGTLATDAIRLSVVCPGFVRTPMTAVNPFPMPFLMDAEPAAANIYRGLLNDKARIAFPWPLYALVWFVALLTPALTDRFINKLPEKPAR
ncbi:MAG TPA: SDR family NAD(P)-dependent oxidoreductase [Alphaproteobacteria bacterium]|jgi:short-subunit dehydrogenase